jgi:hypothetical protein
MNLKKIMLSEIKPGTERQILHDLTYMGTLKTLHSCKQENGSYQRLLWEREMLI